MRCVTLYLALPLCIVYPCSQKWSPSVPYSLARMICFRSRGFNFQSNSSYLRMATKCCDVIPVCTRQLGEQLSTASGWNMYHHYYYIAPLIVKRHRPCLVNFWKNLCLFHRATLQQASQNMWYTCLCHLVGLSTLENASPTTLQSFINAKLNK